MTSTHWVVLLALVSPVSGCSSEDAQSASSSGGAATGGSGGAGAGGTGASAGQAGAGTGGAAGPGAGEVCDPVAQDCADAAAPKCTLVGLASNEPAAVCAAKHGARVEGESCQRLDAATGADDCAPGLYCARHGFPQGMPQERACRPVCVSNDDCGSGRFCYWLTPQAPSDAPVFGICLATCDVLGTACQDKAPGTSCGPAVDPQGVLHPVCDVAGTAPEGAACSTAFDCAPGTTCDGTTCRAYCGDATHTCPTGLVCKPYQKSDPTMSWCVPA